MSQKLDYWQPLMLAVLPLRRTQAGDLSGILNLQAWIADKNNLTGIFGSDFFNNRTTLHGFDSRSARISKTTSD
jgi:hypothetical protein